MSKQITMPELLIIYFPQLCLLIAKNFSTESKPEPTLGGKVGLLCLEELAPLFLPLYSGCLGQ
jgi:hypothetical protein